MHCIWSWKCLKFPEMRQCVGYTESREKGCALCNKISSFFETPDLTQNLSIIRRSPPRPSGTKHLGSSMHTAGAYVIRSFSRNSFFLPSKRVICATPGKNPTTAHHGVVILCGQRYEFYRQLRSRGHGLPEPGRAY